MEINASEVNDMQPIMHQHTVYIPMRALEHIEGLHIQSWNNQTKILIITDQYTNKQLTLNLKNHTALQQNKPLAMNQTALLQDNRVMLPVRWIAEVFQADIVWNSSTHTVQIARATAAQQHKRKSDQLSEARAAALALPIVSPYQDLPVTGDSLGSISLYFYEGRSDAFFITGNGMLTYFTVTDNASHIQYEASFKSVGSNPNPYATAILQQQGKRPSLPDHLIYYDISTHAGEAEYGRLDRNGKRVVFGKGEMNNLDTLLPIEQDSQPHTSQ
ncbi:copper amine oxidase N-terminal domain-containing protein [Paenibacillus kandeliae]|uniref:copper amine oxidase N-terminal domain-containing protein n=1 Tax=Paenibacillus kandeliae TaxID=3231269 RepID=UPI00345B3749